MSALFKWYGKGSKWWTLGSRFEAYRISDWGLRLRGLEVRIGAYGLEFRIRV